MAKIFRCTVVLLVGIVLSTKSAAQQSSNNQLSKGYYIIVAAFFSHQEDYAQRYSSKLNEGGLHTKYGLDPIRKLYFVYLDQYADFNESVQAMLKTRKEGTFKDAWVRTIKEGADARSESIVKKEEQAIQKEKPTEVVKKEESKISTRNTKEGKLTETKVEQPKAGEKKTEEIKFVVTDVIENPKADPVYIPQTLNNTPVFLSLYNMQTNEVIDGDIEVVDAENSRLITRVKGNTYLALPDPRSNSSQLSLISRTFGFRPEQHELHYKNTEADTVQPYVELVGNFYMINFGLSRIHKGDISTLFNVYFYNDAAIMLPESKYQLNSLLQMFKDNPKFKVILHGHTNGSGRGKIISMGPSHDFFKITNDVVNGAGTAKELSQARAQTIKMWLIDQGIDGTRVSVKGWGGSRMIHDKNSAHARKNIRVDVEVTDE